MINGLYLGALHKISTYRSVQIRSDPLVSVTRGGGGDSAYERDGDARRKFGIKVSVNENFSTLLDFVFFLFLA